MSNTFAGRLGEIARSIPPPAAAGFPAAAQSASFEEVFTVYNVGLGVFDDTTAFINLQVDMFDFNGVWAGFQTGVHVNITPPEEVAATLLAVPDKPKGVIDRPPVPRGTTREWTKGLFTFPDGSSLLAQGPAQTHLVPLNDGAFLFMVTTSQVITRGTGALEGVRGIKQGTGTTYVAPGLVQEGKFPAPGFRFTAKVIDSFRLIRPGFVDGPSISGRPEPPAPSTASAARPATKRKAAPKKRSAAKTKAAGAKGGSS